MDVILNVASLAFGSLDMTQKVLLFVILSRRAT
jgi:hypothetical protein